MREWIDTHLHLLYPDRLSYDWTRTIPVLDRAFPLDEYERVAKPLGITRSLHMEVDVPESQIEQESALVRELSLRPGSLLAGAISSCRPEKNLPTAFVDWATTDPLIHGFRRILHVVPDDVSQSDLFRRNVRDLTRKGHTFDICVLARQLPLALDLAKSCPNTTFVLNHCGVPDIAAGEMAAWKRGITQVAELGNVMCKVSGIIVYGDASRWPAGDVDSIARDLKPYVETVIASFGWSRVVWGSDFPVCNLTKGLEAWKATTDLLLKGCSDREIDALASQNAIRIYRLPI